MVTLRASHTLASKRLLLKVRVLRTSPYASSLIADKIERQWVGILAAVIVLYLTLPGDATLLPLLVSCASVIPQAAMDGIDWARSKFMEWRRTMSLPTSDTRAGLMSSVEEGHGSNDSSNLRINPASDAHRDESSEVSSQNRQGEREAPNNAYIARRAFMPGASYAS